jgi:hypothetical protein
MKSVFEKQNPLETVNITIRKFLLWGTFVLAATIKSGNITKKK